MIHPTQLQSNFSRGLYQSTSNNGSSPRFGFSLRSLAQAAVGTVVPVPPEYQQFVYKTAGGQEVRVYVPADMDQGVQSKSSGAPKGLNVLA